MRTILLTLSAVALLCAPAAAKPGKIKGGVKVKVKSGGSSIKVNPKGKVKIKL